MNYLAHAIPFLEDPYFAAGTGIPDWLTVVDRRIRLRSKHLRPFLVDPDPDVAALAAGALQHILDDAKFHGSRAFAELSMRLTAMARDALEDDSGLRPGFLGHLLVEVLLDASLATEEPTQLEAYYRILDTVDPGRIQQVVCRMAGRTTDRLAVLISEFHRRRILSDYLEDGRLWMRLNQVMRRVKLVPLPESFRKLLPEVRRLVDGRRHELLEGIPSKPPGSLPRSPCGNSTRTSNHPDRRAPCASE